MGAAQIAPRHLPLASGAAYLYNFGMIEVFRPASSNLNIKDGMSNTGRGESLRLAGILIVSRGAVLLWCCSRWVSAGLTVVLWHMQCVRTQNT